MSIYFVLIILSSALKVSQCCISGNNYFDPKNNCTSNDGIIPIIPYTNTTIGERIEFCDIIGSKYFQSLRILLNEYATTTTITDIIDFKYTLNLYNYNEWISFGCNNNIYSKCSALPIFELINISPNISIYGNIPSITFNFENQLIINESNSYTSYIWIMNVNNGFEANNGFDATDISFIACDIYHNVNNIQYEIYPTKYRNNNNTSFMYQLIETCSTKNDNSLTELNPYTMCDYDPLIKPEDIHFNQKVIGLPFKSNGDSLFQYFAVTQTTEIFGITLYMKSAKNLQNMMNENCVFIGNMELYEMRKIGDDYMVGSISNVEIGGLNDTAIGIEFILNESIFVNIVEFNKYFYFKITISNGITLSDIGGTPGSKTAINGNNECGITTTACFDASNMKTWLVEHGESIEKCRDFYYDEPRDKQYNNVDIGFKLITNNIDKTTINPTSNPTLNPLIQSTYYTTTTIMTMIDSDDDITSTSTDIIITELNELNAKESLINFEESDALSITIGIFIGIGLLLVLFAFICSFITKSDNFIYSSIVLFVIHSIDVFSDVFFCISIWTDHVLMDIEGNIIFLILAICSLLCIVIPMIKNFYDLIKFQTETQNDPLHGDRYRSWLGSFGTTLLILSLISGSTFGSMKLMNSNLFGLRMFSMGLCLSHLREYDSHRMVNVVLLENLPQLIIQIIFAASLSTKIPIISILATITSIFSIIVAIVDHFSKKQLKKQDVPSQLFTFKITSQSISNKPSSFKNRQKVISHAISKILSLDQMAVDCVEILTMNEYSDNDSDGLIIYFLITTIQYTSIDIHKKLQNAVNNGLMDRSMNKAWNMKKEQPHISSLQWLQIQCVDNNNNDEMIEGVNTDTTTTKTTTAITNNLSNIKQKKQSVKKQIVIKADNIYTSISDIDDEENNIIATTVGHKQITEMITPIINDNNNSNSTFPEIHDNIKDDDNNNNNNNNNDDVEIEMEDV